MSASVQDISLTIIRGGTSAFYGAVKGCGALIWDIRTGLYAEEASEEDPHHVLDWLTDSDWSDSVELLAAPLGDPIYGHVTIDFDRKIVIDQNRYGSSDSMYFYWLYNSLEDAAGGHDGIIPSESLKEHLAQGRIQVAHDTGHPDGALIGLESQTIEAAVLECQGKIDAARVNGTGLPTWAVLKPPVGWTFQSL